MTTGRSGKFAAAVYVLLEPTLIRERTAAYIDFEREEIDFQGLVAISGAWSGGERLLLQVAQDMWTGNADCSLGECIRTLDDGNIRVLINALSIRRGLGIPVEAGDPA